MKRPEEHVKETKSIKIFESQIPNEWISRKFDQDYGLDKNVEIVVGKEVTGKHLFFQLKSSEHFDYKETYIPSHLILNIEENLEAIKKLEDFEERIASKEHEIGLELSLRYEKEGLDTKSLTKLKDTYDKTKVRDPINHVRAVEGLTYFLNPANANENEQLFRLTSEGLKLAEKIKNEIYTIHLRGVLLETVYF